MSKVSAYERQHLEAYQEKYRKAISYLHADEERSADVAVVQWARGVQPIPCQWLKAPEAPVGFNFDISKTEQIFDLLLKEKL